jgi:hypothetical protein
LLQGLSKENLIAIAANIPGTLAGKIDTLPPIERGKADKLLVTGARDFFEDVRTLEKLEVDVKRVTQGERPLQPNNAERILEEHTKR